MLQVICPYFIGSWTLKKPLHAAWLCLFLFQSNNKINPNPIEFGASMNWAHLSLHQEHVSWNHASPMNHSTFDWISIVPMELDMSQKQEIKKKKKRVQMLQYLCLQYPSDILPSTKSCWQPTIPTLEMWATYETKRSSQSKTMHYESNSIYNLSIFPRSPTHRGKG